MAKVKTAAKAEKGRKSEARKREWIGKVTDNTLFLLVTSKKLYSESCNKSSGVLCHQIVPILLPCEVAKMRAAFSRHKKIA